MSYANMDGVPTQTAGTSEILASDWNTYVRDNFDSIKFGHVTVADDSAKSALSVAEGTMVYQLDNQKVFVYSGSAWVEISDLDSADGLSASAQSKVDNIGLVFITSASPSSVSSTSFNNCFSSSYKNYRILGSVGQVLDFRLRNSGSDDSTSNYDLMGTETSVGSGVYQSTTSANNLWSITAGGTRTRQTFTMDLFNPFGSEVTRFFAHSTSTNASFANAATRIMGGEHRLTSSYDGFTLSTVNNASGFIAVYGYKE